uniref:Uncharacterized protein n=1 Tax=Setaria italica TaxID=4555 RepID=K3Z203_SETIT
MRGLKVQAYGFEGVMHVLHIAARIWCLRRSWEGDLFTRRMHLLIEL